MQLNNIGGDEVTYNCFRCDCMLDTQERYITSDDKLTLSLCEACMQEVIRFCMVTMTKG